MRPGNPHGITAAEDDLQVEPLVTQLALRGLTLAILRHKNRSYNFYLSKEGHFKHRADPLFGPWNGIFPTPVRAYDT
jgi:hypothetical protein